MHFRLRYQNQDFDLSGGQFLIGRSADCQISLDDPLVSRHHARLMVHGENIVVEDLGSRNGVRVNGEKIDKSCQLSASDRVTIGGQELVLLPPRDNNTGPVISRGAPTHRLDRFGVIGGLADKALALGRGDEAERVLNALMADMLLDASAGRDLDNVDRAGRYAAKLAGATGKGKWVSYVADLYMAIERPPPADIIDDLYAGLRKVDAVDVGRLRQLLDALQRQAADLGPADRFLVRRVEGLIQLAAAR
jgi:hypothetical protein